MRPTACLRAGAFFVALLAMFLVSGKAHAATFCVGTASELQAALNTAAGNSEDDVVMIRQGAYEGNFSYVSYQPYDLGIGGGFGGAGGGCTTRTADASNTILDADGSGNVLYITTEHEVVIAIDAITLQNGDTDNELQINTIGSLSGGGLFVNAPNAAVIVQRSAITGNSAYWGGGAYVNAYNGEAIFTDNEISDNTSFDPGGGVYVNAGASLFEGNAIDMNTSSNGSGGGVYLGNMHIQRSAVFTNNTISDNSAYYSGGGVYVENGQYLASSSMGAELVDVLTITGGTFGANSAGNSGGGLYSDVANGSAVITGATFSNNTANNNGGGVFLSNGGETTLSGNTFDTNSADNDGGGAYVVYANGVVELSGNAFDANTAGHDGGGAFINYSYDAVELSDNTFDLNTASNDGGGASIDENDDTVTLTDNIFTSNSSTNADGGGTHIEYNSGVVTLTGNTFTSNTASESERGGGAHIEDNDSDVTLTDNTFTSNTAGDDGGGADIRSNSGVVTVTGNTFTSNTADNGGSGGGACIEDNDGDVTVSNNTFDSNAADDDGGGVSLSNGGDTALTGNTLDGNSSDGDGGGAYLEAETLIAVNNVVSDNASNDDGGGLYVNAAGNSEATLTNNTVTGNTASYGAGVYVYQYYDFDTIDIYNNIIWGNNEPPVAALATDDGTDLYLENDGNNNETGSTVNLFNNDFDQSSEGFFATVAFTPDSSNLDNADPLFFDAGDDDYRLWGVPVGTAPPVADMGDDSAPQIPTTDKDGNDRIAGDAVDMGAYEFAGIAVPDLKVNNDDGPLSVTQGTTLTITGSLSSGAYTGEIVEAFASIESPLGTFWRTLAGWVPSDTPVQLFEGPLADFPVTTLFSGPAAMTGDFTIEFTMDTTLDNDISEGAVSDSVAVTVTPPTRARK